MTSAHKQIVTQLYRQVVIATPNFVTAFAGLREEP